MKDISINEIVHSQSSIMITLSSANMMPMLLANLNETFSLF